MQQRQTLLREASQEQPSVRAALPLWSQEVSLGALVLTYPAGHVFAAEEGPFLQTLAAQCAVALSRQHELTQRQRHEQRFERLVAESPVDIAAGDLSGKLTLVNDTYLRMLGFSRAEFELGQIDWASLTPPEYRASDEAAFQRAFAVGRSGRYEKEMLTRSGERFPVDVSLIRFDAGDTGSVVG